MFLNNRYYFTQFKVTFTTYDYSNCCSIVMVLAKSMLIFSLQMDLVAAIYLHSNVLVVMFANFCSSIASQWNYVPLVSCLPLRSSDLFALALDLKRPISTQIVELSVSYTHSQIHSNLQYSLNSSVHSFCLGMLATVLDFAIKIKEKKNILISIFQIVFFLCYETYQFR